MPAVSKSLVPLSCVAHRDIPNIADDISDSNLDAAIRPRDRRFTAFARLARRRLPAATFLTATPFRRRTGRR